MSTFRGFVAGVLGEAKKRKISTRGEDLLLQLPTATGEVTAEAGEQPAATSREGDFSILAITHRNGRLVNYSGQRARYNGSRKAQPSLCDSGRNFKRGYKKENK